MPIVPSGFRTVTSPFEVDARVESTSTSSVPDTGTVRANRWQKVPPLPPYPRLAQRASSGRLRIRSPTEMCDACTKLKSDVSSRVIGTYLVSVKYPDLDTLTSAPETPDTFFTSDKWYEPLPSVT